MRQPPDTKRSLPFVLLQARENVMAPVRAMLADTGLTEQQWRILRVLGEAGSLSTSEIAERASLLLSSATRITQTMAIKNLVRQNNDPSDKRRQVTELTKEGHAMLHSNLPRAAEIAESFQTHLGSERYETLLDLLQALDGIEKE